MSAPVFIDMSPQFVAKNQVVLDSALGRMSQDIKLVAKETVPIGETGDLSDSVNNQRLGMLIHRVVVDKVYAAFQERGMRRDGSHVVKKYTTPNTGKKFLFNAAKQVVKDALNYLKQAVHSV